VKERPILFSGEMVKAILADTTPQRKLYAPRGANPCAPEHLALRVMRGIREISTTGCWIWGKSTSTGYGSLTVAGRNVRVHRLVLALVSGKPERDLDEVCHNCPGGDNPLCCNPDHLFEGTHGDNVRDAVAKGRLRPPVGPRLCGADNPRSKLTHGAVAEIRALLAAGETQSTVADRYSVSQSVISLIHMGKRWAHA
jgi:hypothetical protein